jgi:multisubunit Na+/H+ antiporter MnhB subunit
MGYTGVPVIINKGFTTGVYSGIAMYVLYMLMKKQPEESINFLSNRRKMFGFVSIVILYLAGLFEILFQFDFHFPGMI